MEPSYPACRLRFTYVPIRRMTELRGKIQKEPKFFGRGGQADIFKGVWTPENGVEVIVAIKQIRLCVNECTTKKARDKLIREGRIWASLEHPNIAPFFGVRYDLGPLGAPCFVMPYYENGDVNKYLANHADANRLQLVCQVVAGLEYLHNLKVRIVHGDIKSVNILINDKGMAVLADFGIACALECSGFTTTGKVSIRWTASERIDDLSVHFNPSPTLATDVWAFAMCVLEILTGRMPYFSIGNEYRVVLAIARGILPEPKDYPGISDDVWKILRTCWIPNPTQRPSTRELSMSFNRIAAPQSSQTLVTEVPSAKPFCPITRQCYTYAPEFGTRPTTRHVSRFHPQKRRHTMPCHSLNARVPKLAECPYTTRHICRLREPETAHSSTYVF